MNHGPWHVQEFAGWIESLLRAMVGRYGEERASGFWFRVGTEPNTRPGHWNDSNAKYVEEYVAVSETVAKVLPLAKVGLANMGADGSSWETRVMPMAKGIADAKARVDFIAMSCYGRGTLRRYSIGTAALCSERLQRMRKLGGERWAQLPAQSMEYGLQQNTLGVVDEDPGVFGAAWMLATSVAHARNDVERGFQWPAMIETAFSHDDGACSAQLSPTPCSLYGGTAWVRAQAGHLFGADAATAGSFVLEAPSTGSNATADPEGRTETSVDGIGGWSQSGDELRLLLTAFSPSAKTQDGAPVAVQVTVDRPPSWPAQAGLEMRSATLNRTTSTFDTILRESLLHHPDWLANASDPNCYPLSHSRRALLTPAGKYALVQQQGAAYLAMQRRTFASSEWRDASATAGGSVACGAETCTVTIVMATPSVAALWVRSGGGRLKSDDGATVLGRRV